MMPAVVRPKIYYSCLFCDEYISHLEDEFPIYKIVEEQCGKRELCICPKCIKKISNLMRKENEVK